MAVVEFEKGLKLSLKDFVTLIHHQNNNTLCSVTKGRMFQNQKNNITLSVIDALVAKQVVHCAEGLRRLRWFRF